MAITTPNKLRLEFTKAPVLPLTPVAYAREYQDQLNNALRLYFSQLDSQSANLLGTGGGRFFSFPHIAAQDNSNQYATATNTATKVLWSTLDSGVGFTLNADSTAQTEMAGIYKIDYSLQFANTNTQIHDVYVWLHVNGYDVAGSGSRFSIPNSHGGVPGYLVAYSSVTFEVPAGEKIALYWATNQAATSGGGTGVYMATYAAQTSPFAMPSTPSAIGSIVFVSGITT